MKFTTKSHIPPMDGIPEQTEPDHFGRTFNTPSKRRRASQDRKDIIIWIALLAFTAAEVVILWHFNGMLVK